MTSRPRFVNATVRTSAPFELRSPFRESDVRQLPLGATVSISGTIYTGRDRLHKYLAEGGETPADLHDGAIFHCGPVVVKDSSQPAGWRIIAAGPTTSSRENPYMPKIIAGNGVRVILGKGGMGPEIQTACREHGCVYIQVVGGAAAWLAKCVKRVEDVWFYDEFGATEAMWKLTVEGLTGIVTIDANGESIFSGVEQLSKARLNTLLGSPLVIEGGSDGAPALKYAPPHASAGAPPPLRIVFMGSADVSCRVLRALHMTPGFVIQGVITQPDRPSGRYRHLQPCEAKTAALALDLPVITPEKVNAQEVRSQIVDWRPDVIVVVAYGQFLGPKILSLPPLGCLNVHLSLLPRYRGAAPVHRCINAGDTVSGVTIMRMDPGMDSGDIIMQESEPIHADDTAGTLHERLSELGASLIVKCLPKWRAGLIIPHAQKPEFVTFANKLTKEEAKLDWAEESAADLARHVRAFNPWPACYTFFEYTRHGRTQTERLKILRARAEDFPEGAARTPAGTVADISPDGPAIATNGGMLRLLEVQRPGARAISGADFLRGCPVRVMQNFDAPQPPPPTYKKKDKDKSKDKNKTSDAHDD